MIYALWSMLYDLCSVLYFQALYSMLYAFTLCPILKTLCAMPFAPALCSIPMFYVLWSNLYALCSLLLLHWSMVYALHSFIKVYSIWSIDFCLCSLFYMLYVVFLWSMVYHSSLCCLGNLFFYLLCIISFILLVIGWGGIHFHILLFKLLN